MAVFVCVSSAICSLDTFSCCWWWWWWFVFCQREVACFCGTWCFLSTQCPFTSKMGLTSSYCVQTLGEKNIKSPKSSSLGYIFFSPNLFLSTSNDRKYWSYCFFFHDNCVACRFINLVQIFFSCWTFDSPQFKRQLDCGTLYFFNFSWLPSDVEQLSDWNQDFTFLLYYVPHETGSASLKNASILVEAKPRVLVLHQAWADPVTARFAPFLKQKKVRLQT